MAKAVKQIDPVTLEKYATILRESGDYVVVPRNRHVVVTSQCLAERIDLQRFEPSFVSKHIHRDLASTLINSAVAAGLVIFGKGDADTETEAVLFNATASFIKPKE